MARGSAILLVALMALVARTAAAAPATPTSAYFQFGWESAAYTDGPGSILFNPAAGRYQNELSGTWIERGGDKALGRAALTRRGGMVSASFERDAAITPSVSWVLGRPKFRLGLVATWMPVEGGEREMDYRAGAVMRGNFLTAGFVAEHVTEPTVAGAELQRLYTAGIAVHPFANARWGQRFTLTMDGRFAGSESNPEYRYGTEIVLVEGLALRGLYFENERGFQLGISALGIHSGYFGQFLRDSGGDKVYGTHTISIHQEKDKTVLLPPEDKPTHRPY